MKKTTLIKVLASKSRSRKLISKRSKSEMLPQMKQCRRNTSSCQRTTAAKISGMKMIIRQPVLMPQATSASPMVRIVTASRKIWIDCRWAHPCERLLLELVYATLCKYLLEVISCRGITIRGSTPQKVCKYRQGR